MNLATGIILILLLVAIQAYLLINLPQHFWAINIISWMLALVIGLNTKSARQ